MYILQSSLIYCRHATGITEASLGDHCQDWCQEVECKVAETGAETHWTIHTHIAEHFGKTAALSEDQAQEMILGVSNYHCH